MEKPSETADLALRGLATIEGASTAARLGGGVGSDAPRRLVIGSAERDGARTFVSVRCHRSVGKRPLHFWHLRYIYSLPPSPPSFSHILLSHPSLTSFSHILLGSKSRGLCNCDGSVKLWIQPFRGVESHLFQTKQTRYFQTSGFPLKERFLFSSAVPY